MLAIKKKERNMSSGNADDRIPSAVDNDARDNSSVPSVEEAPASVSGGSGSAPREKAEAIEKPVNPVPVSVKAAATAPVPEPATPHSPPSIEAAPAPDEKGQNMSDDVFDMLSRMVDS